MRHFVAIVFGALAATPLFAGPEILPIKGVHYLHYDVATGKMTQENGERRYGHSLWAATESSGYFWGSVHGEVGLDWGDIAGPVPVGGFVFTEFTNSSPAHGDAWAVIMIYAEENGWNSSGRIAIAGFLIENLPTSPYIRDEYWGYICHVELETPFVIDGSDLDSDGLVDFGYAQWFVWPSPGAYMGPGIAGDPNADPPTAPGIEDAIDIFIDPNLFTDPNLTGGSFQGTYWFGGDPFAQFYFELLAPGCPNPGNSGRYCIADIDGSFDCIVDLSDLAVLLNNYGMTTGATFNMGDIEPYDSVWPGDGDIDLGDLSELLSQYGDDCN